MPNNEESRPQKSKRTFTALEQKMAYMKKNKTNSKTSKSTVKKATTKKSSKKTFKRKIKPKKLKLGLPVIPTPSSLPLLDPNFTWENFEAFAKSLIQKLNPNHTVNLFGIRGQKQFGIDLIAQGTNGKYFYAQNKKYKKFSVAQFKKAKKEMVLPNQKTILFLSCEASSELRLEVMGDQLWEIWDVHDISDKVLTLEKSVRNELVKRHFGPEWAKVFCDYNHFSSLASPIEFFRAFLDSKKIFNHTIPFLGRDKEVQSLGKFLKSNAKAMIMSAAGGVGKSRLLWEFSKFCEENKWTILFIREDMAPIAEHFQNITAEKVIFVFDDAHRFDPTPYLSYIYSSTHKYKIIFSTRPQGRQKLKLGLRKNNLESAEMQDVEVDRFTPEEGKLIVNKLLPQIDNQHVWHLAKLFSDSTLVGILACNLIRKKSVTLSSLANEEDIKERIIANFTDELAGRIDTKLSNDFVQKLLKNISALAPIIYEQGKLDPTITTILNEDENLINECVADLLYSGIIIDRGGHIRISPDVLSDCILEDSCYLKNGIPSGFFLELFEKVDGKLRENLLVNISELDWRKKNSELANSVLLKGFWEKFKHTDHDHIRTINAKLDIVKSISYFQPIESYEVVKSAIDSILNKPDLESGYYLRDCISSIVRICRDIIITGYEVDDLMMILWDLGKRDQRNLNPHPEHPIRQLSDLCSYDRGMPVALYEQTLHGLKLIIAIYDSNQDFHNPIEMLKGFLAKTAHSTYSEGNSISWSPFHISYENTKSIRDQVFEILLNLGKSNNLKSAYYAISVLSDALSSPHGMLGLQVDKRHVQSWLPEMKYAANCLIDIYKSTPFDLIKIQVKNKLNLRIRGGRKSSLSSTIKPFLKSNKFSRNELRYVPFAFWTFNDLLVPRDYENFEKNYERNQKEEQRVFDKTSTEILSSFGSTQELIKYTESTINELLLVNESISSTRFSYVISEQIDCQNMCEELLLNNSNILERDFGVFLNKVRIKDVQLSFNIIRKALGLKNEIILNSIADSYWWIYADEIHLKDTLEIFKSFYKSDIESVKLSSLSGLRGLTQKNTALALDIMLDFKVSSKRSAELLLTLIEARYNISPDHISDDQLKDLLSKIKDIDDISEHHIDEFIKICSKRIPLPLIDMLLYRVESKKEQDTSYVALPYLGFKKLELNLTPEQLIVVFDRIVISLKKEDSEKFWLPNLFYDFAKGNFDVSLAYLRDLIKSDNIEDVKVGTKLLRKFNCNLIFSNQELIRQLLTHGKEKNALFFEEIKSGLFLLGLPSSKQGTAGEPYPQDVALVEGSIKAINSSKYDYEKQFYRELKEYGEREIARTMKRNQRMYD